MTFGGAIREWHHEPRPADSWQSQSSCNPANPIKMNYRSGGISPFLLKKKSGSHLVDGPVYRATLQVGFVSGQILAAAIKPNPR